MTLSNVYPSLAGKTVFITGGATGIGAGLVRAFADQGARVAFIDRDEVSGETLAESIAENNELTSWFRPVDVADVSALQSAVRDVASEFGPIAVLVNNVGNDTRMNPDDIDEKSWRGSLAVNLDATFFATQAVVPSMRDGGGGSIINMSSINALLGPAMMPAYVTAKAGLVGMTKSLARDYGGDRIRVNAILPGWVVTERQLELWLTPEAEAEWSKLVALKDRLMPEDIAGLALYLASDDSRMLTGQAIAVDGGRT